MSSTEKKDENLNYDFSQVDPNVVRLDIYEGKKEIDDSLYQFELESSETDPECWSLNREERRISIFKDDSIVTSFADLKFSEPDWLKENNREFSEEWTTINQKVDSEAKVYGLGEKSGHLEKSGARYEMWNVDPGGFYQHHEDPLYTSIPFYILVRPDDAVGPKYLGLYLANPHYSQFDVKYLSGPDNVGISVNSDSLTLFLIIGDSVNDIVERYTDLTGKPCLLPRWALGYHHSKYGMPNNQEEAIELMEKFRDKGIPCDSLYLDIQHMQDYKIFTWDEDRFSDFSGLMEELHEMDIKPVTIQDPGVKVEENYDVYESGNEQDVFVKDREGNDFIGMLWPGLSKYPDFVRKDVREWWGDQNAKVLEKGVSGIWNDMNEPAVFFEKDELLEQMSKLEEKIREGEILRDDFFEFSLYLENQSGSMVHQDDDGNELFHNLVHNLYVLLEAKGTLEGFDSVYPKKRPFILTRAGCPGIQKRAALWTGDNSSTWEHMKMSIQMVLNLGLSGVPFTGADVGGFDGDVEPELLTRWVQLGSVIPLFRNHSSIGTVPQEPWSFGDPYERIIKRYIELRYELLLYLYTLHHRSHKTGLPIVRPLFMEFPHDDETLEMEDEFMVGDSLLVAPIVGRNAESRRVYLPYGENSEKIKWENWWTGNVLESGYHTVDSALDIMPMFIREDSCLPVIDPVQSTEENGDTLYLRCNLDDEAKTSIYWDDGKSKGFEEGEYFYGKVRVWRDDGIKYSVEPEKENYEPFWDSIEVQVKTVGD